MSNSKLIVRHLQKTYGKRTVVSNVSLDVSSGEVVGLLGPNGAGKTTSFYMIVGLVPADDGVIERVCSFLLGPGAQWAEEAQDMQELIDRCITFCVRVSNSIRSSATSSRTSLYIFLWLINFSTEKVILPPVIACSFHCSMVIKNVADFVSGS